MGSKSRSCLSLSLQTINAFSSGPGGGLEHDEKPSRGGKWLGGPRDTHAGLTGSSTRDRPARLHKPGSETRTAVLLGDTLSP